MKTIRLADEAHWKALRHDHVGGSEIAALFGEHAQVSRFELWNRKKGLVDEPDLSDNERVLWGQLLEPAVAQGVAAKTGWKIQKVRRYISALPELGLGGSLDYEIVGHERGPGVLEIKTADWLIVRNWEEGEPPLSYELQAQAYMRLRRSGWGCIAVLVGGNDLRLFLYDRRPKTIEIIETEVKAFWQSVAENKPPKPDWETDGETVRRLYSAVAEGKVIDLTGSNRAPELIAEYQQAGADERAGKLRREAAKAELLTLIGDAEVATCGKAKISAKTVKATHIVFDRKAYRDFRISGSI
jgi:predicted phage-related endonuclease